MDIFSQSNFFTSNTSNPYFKLVLLKDTEGCADKGIDLTDLYNKNIETITVTTELGKKNQSSITFKYTAAEPGAMNLVLPPSGYYGEPLKIAIVVGYKEMHRLGEFVNIAEPLEDEDFPKFVSTTKKAVVPKDATIFVGYINNPNIQGNDRGEIIITMNLTSGLPFKKLNSATPSLVKEASKNPNHFGSGVEIKTTEKVDVSKNQRHDLRFVIVRLFEALSSGFGGIQYIPNFEYFTENDYMFDKAPITFNDPHFQKGLGGADENCIRRLQDYYGITYILHTCPTFYKGTGGEEVYDYRTLPDGTVKSIYGPSASKITKGKTLYYIFLPGKFSGNAPLNLKCPVGTIGTKDMLYLSYGVEITDFHFSMNNNPKVSADNKQYVQYGDRLLSFTVDKEAVKKKYQEIFGKGSGTFSAVKAFKAVMDYIRNAASTNYEAFIRKYSQYAVGGNLSPVSPLEKATAGVGIKLELTLRKTIPGLREGVAIWFDKAENATIPNFLIGKYIAKKVTTTLNNKGRILEQKIECYR